MKTFLILTSGLMLLCGCQTIGDPQASPYNYDLNNPKEYYKKLEKEGLNPNYQPDYRLNRPSRRT